MTKDLTELIDNGQLDGILMDVVGDILNSGQLPVVRNKRTLQELTIRTCACLLLLDRENTEEWELAGILEAEDENL